MAANPLKTRGIAAGQGSRRRFLLGAATAAASFPMAAAAQAPIALRFQGAWSAKNIFHEFALDYAKKVNDMSGGRLRIEVLPAGAVVKPFDLLDAVHKGVLDGCHAVSAYWSGKNSAFSLFGTGPALGLDANQFLAWMEYGGGKAFYEELLNRVLSLDVTGFLYGPMPTQPLGWFKKAITAPAQLKGLKYRTVGLSVDLFRELGAVVNALPEDAIVAAMKTGTIDAAEFNNVSSDWIVGIPDVAKICMLQSYHQPAETFEILVNRKKHDALPTDLRLILKHAAEAASADMSWKAMHRYSEDHVSMREKQGVKFQRTSAEMLRAQMKAWGAVAARQSRDNPFFERVFRSQQAWARRTVAWARETVVDPRIAYDFWFARPKTPAKSK
jgi:TRAP-type mannitol/chloroaromatic compound transport system substrate-binding protein